MRAVVQRCLVLAALLAAALVVPAASGAAEQDESCVKPSLEIQDPPALFEPGVTETLAVIIENVNTHPVERVEARVGVQAPTGWRAVIADSQFTYAGPNTTHTNLAITPPQRGAGDIEGRVNVTVAFACSIGAVVTGPVERSAELHVRVQETQLSWLFLSGLGLATVVGVTAFWAFRGRTGLVHATCRQSVKTIRPGRGASFSLNVENRGAAPDRVRFELTGVEDGWSAHLAIPEIELEPREERSLWLMVRPPKGAQAGDEVRVTVRAASMRHPEEGANVTVRARVG